MGGLRLCLRTRRIFPNMHSIHLSRFLHPLFSCTFSPSHHLTCLFSFLNAIISSASFSLSLSPFLFHSLSLYRDWRKQRARARTRPRGVFSPPELYYGGLGCFPFTLLACTTFGAGPPLSLSLPGMGVGQDPPVSSPPVSLLRERG